MTATTPYFLRNTLADVPGQRGMPMSPDIVFSTSGPPDWMPQPGTPSSYITAAGYGTDYGSAIQSGGIVNEVYVRALNTDPSAQIPTRLWLMLAEYDLIPWPQKWRSDGISVADQSTPRNYQDGDDLLSGGPEPYVVTQLPFLVVAPPVRTSYSCIAMAEPFPGADPPNSLSNPPSAPPAAAEPRTWDQLVQFLRTNDGFAWRNSRDVSSLGSVWQQIIPFTGPEEGGGTINVGIQCLNMPTDGFISASMAGPNVQNSFHLPKTQITMPNMNLSVPITLPPGFRTSMVVSYWQGATTPPAMAAVVPTIQVHVSTVEGILDGPRPGPPVTRTRLHDPVSMQPMGWQKTYRIGAAPLVWGTPPPPGQLKTRS